MSFYNNFLILLGNCLNLKYLQKVHEQKERDSVIQQQAECKEKGESESSKIIRLKTSHKVASSAVAIMVAGALIQYSTMNQIHSRWIKEDRLKKDEKATRHGPD